jgi:hypothetical protein
MNKILIAVISQILAVINGILFGFSALVFVNHDSSLESFLIVFTYLSSAVLLGRMPYSRKNIDHISITFFRVIIAFARGYFLISLFTNEWFRNFDIDIVQLVYIMVELVSIYFLISMRSLRTRFKFPLVFRVD